MKQVPKSTKRQTKQSIAIFASKDIGVQRTVFKLAQTVNLDHILKETVQIVFCLQITHFQ